MLPAASDLTGFYNSCTIVMVTCIGFVPLEPEDPTFNTGWALAEPGDGGPGVSSEDVSTASAIQRGRLAPRTPALRIRHLPGPPSSL
jgi:hypothetical protein